ncbi:MAG: hypothetical protein IH985_00610 [Planctomycetes bacterium]|nr:hypothetical protein [Planctomycetota bacterium]
MDRLRLLLVTIGTHLRQLGATQKLLIGSGVIIMLMSLFLVSQYAGRTEMMSLGDAASNQQVVDYLQTSTWVEGRDYRMTSGGEILVRPSVRYKLAAEMAETGSLPTDTKILFDNLIDFQTFTMTNRQHREQATIARQNELARVLTEFKAIRTARVILSIPEPRGIGAKMNRGKAIASVTTVGDLPLTQTTVEAVARIVSGANSSIGLLDVEVIDASNGKSRHARNPEDQAPADRLAYARTIENDFTRKIMGLYGGIKGLAVIVTADVDISRARIDEMRTLPEGNGSESFTTRESIRDTSDSTAERGLQPGIQSNTGASIGAGSSAGGRISTTSDTELDYSPVPGTIRRQTEDPGGDWTFLATTIGVPRGWIVEEIIRARVGSDDPSAEPAPPMPEEIQQRFDQVSQEMTDAVQLHMQYKLDSGAMVAGEVKVTLLPLDYTQGEGLTVGASSPVGPLWVFGGGGSIGGGLIDKVVLGALAAIALGMMLLMVRKAGKRAELPTAEELVGIPPALTPEDDIVGEADESEAPLTGIEVDDNEVRNRKILDQVEELVGEDPETAARLIHRWSTADV